MNIEIGDVVRQKCGEPREIGVVISIVDKYPWFPTADILYSDGSLSWGYLVDLEVISESR